MLLTTYKIICGKLMSLLNIPQLHGQINEGVCVYTTVTLLFVDAIQCRKNRHLPPPLPILCTPPCQISIIFRLYCSMRDTKHNFNTIKPAFSSCFLMVTRLFWSPLQHILCWIDNPFLTGALHTWNARAELNVSLFYLLVKWLRLEKTFAF
jgi:hypothetical protein